MKKLLYIVLPFLCILNLVSCSSFVNEKTGSLTIQFNAEDFEPARAADSVYRSDNYHITLNISGGYSYSELIDLGTNDTYSATFDSIAVGSDIDIEVNVFKPFKTSVLTERNGIPAFYHFYRGKNTAKIKSGQNIINLSLDSLTEYNRINSEDGYKQFGAQYEGISYGFNSAPTLYCFKSGKYQITATGEWNDDEEAMIYYVLSEGIWEGNYDTFTNGGTVKFTEYIYPDVIEGMDGPEFTETYTIVKNPKTTQVTFYKPDWTEVIESWDFQSANGIRYYAFN